MKNTSIILGFILLFIASQFIPVISADTFNSHNKNTIETNNPTLLFYFDKQVWMLYLENIGDETAYNISISIHTEGFIIFGNEEDFYFEIVALEPGNKTSMSFFPLLIGFGPIRAIYTADVVNADSISITLKAFLIGPWPFFWGYYGT